MLSWHVTYLIRHIFGIIVLIISRIVGNAWRTMSMRITTREVLTIVIVKNGSTRLNYNPKQKSFQQIINLLTIRRVKKNIENNLFISVNHKIISLMKIRYTHWWWTKYINSLIYLCIESLAVYTRLRKLRKFLWVINYRWSITLRYVWTIHWRLKEI